MDFLDNELVYNYSNINSDNIVVMCIEICKFLVKEEWNESIVKKSDKIFYINNSGMKYLILGEREWVVPPESWEFLEKNPKFVVEEPIETKSDAKKVLKNDWNSKENQYWIIKVFSSFTKS